MEQLTFTISSYTVEINQQILNSHYPTINLTGIAGHGASPTSVKAALFFLPEHPYKTHVGMINVAGKPFEIELWFELTAFAAFYQVLSSEKPVSMKIVCNGFPGVPPLTSFIGSASLLTGIEVPGDYEKA